MVERYAPDHMMTGSGMTARRDGGWVCYSDYARLQEHVETLKGSLILAELERKSAIETAKSVVQESYRAAEYLDRAEAAEAERDRLRKALQEYENPSNWSVNGRFDANSPRFDGTSFAHGVLAAIQKEPQPPAQERDDGR